MTHPLTCTSTHCERRQDCASPSECTGDGKHVDPIIMAMSWIAEASDLLLSVDLDMRVKRQLAAPAAIIEGLRPYINQAGRCEEHGIAADHAMIGWAMRAGAARWESLRGGRGEFCINGICHATKLDEFGVPKMTATMRAAIAKAKGTPA